MAISARRFQLTARPIGVPTADDFEIVDVDLDTSADRPILVENLHYSVDPYHREAMDGDWALHAPLEGRTLGRVLVSDVDDVAPGDIVFHRQGYSTHAALTTAETRVIRATPGVPLTAYLGIAGGTGLTAYVGLTRIAGLSAGESVFITAAAGAVGSAAAQIAGALGASRVVGLTGNEEKVERLRASGLFARVENYRDAAALASLQADEAGTFDVALEGVGGEQLALAIDLAADHGRIAWVGAIGQYNSVEPPTAPRNLFTVVDKQIRLEGYLVASWTHVRDEYEAFILPRIAHGEVTVDETIADGFDATLDALFSVLTGRNIGKQLVTLRA